MKKSLLIAVVAGAAATGGALADVIEIPAMTVPHTVLDFDQMAVGPTTLDEINSTFGVNIPSLTLFEAGRGGSTDYGTNAVGNGLKPDLNGDLEVQAPDTSSPGEMEGFEIVLPGLSTEFGFSVGDRVGTIQTIEFYDGNTLVGSYNDQATQDGELHYFQSDVPFDRVVVMEAANWVIPEFAIEDVGGGCPADLDGDGDADVNDFFLYLDLFDAGDPGADITGDGTIDVNDFFAYLDLFERGC